MRTLVLVACAAAVVAPAAFAFPAQPLLSAVDRAEISRILPHADLSHLTAAQAGALSAALHSHDGKDVGMQIRAILG